MRGGSFFVAACVQALFKQANIVRVSEFLGRDFALPESRAAAAKNAFALLGQHRHETAAAFFILAGGEGPALGGLGSPTCTHATCIIRAEHKVN